MNMMEKRSIIWLIMVLPVLFASCVAKKKYLEMEAGRLKAEQQVRELTAANNDKAERIKGLIADFEDIKGVLLASNALKDQYIDSLNTKVSDLSSKINEKSESLEEKDYAFEFEKRRLNNALVERDKKINELQEEIASLEKGIAQKTSEAEINSFNLKEAKGQTEKLNAEKKLQEEKLESLQKKINGLQAQIKALQEEAKEKDATITRLTNNVKLLKDQLGK